MGKSRRLPNWEDVLAFIRNATGNVSGSVNQIMSGVNVNSIPETFRNMARSITGGVTRGANINSLPKSNLRPRSKANRAAQEAYRNMPRGTTFFSPYSSDPVEQALLDWSEQQSKDAESELASKYLMGLKAKGQWDNQMHNPQRRRQAYMNMARDGKWDIESENYSVFPQDYYDILGRVKDIKATRAREASRENMKSIGRAAARAALGGAAGYMYGRNQKNEADDAATPDYVQYTTRKRMTQKRSIAKRATKVIKTTNKYFK